MNTGNNTSLDMGLLPFQKDKHCGDYQKAFQLWKPLAERGRPTAQANLGLMYANGEGVPEDDVIESHYSIY
jgi:hypothetical protein